MAICWICGKPDKMTFPAVVTRRMVSLVIDGNPVQAHESCARDEGYIKPELKNGRLPKFERVPKL